MIRPLILPSVVKLLKRMLRNRRGLSSCVWGTLPKSVLVSSPATTVATITKSVIAATKSQSATHASSYKIGAVLSHVLPDGTEHLTAYASRTLKPSERNYAQLERKLCC